MSTWVLVAHRTGARLFEHKGHELSLIKSIDHPAGRIQTTTRSRPTAKFPTATLGRHAADQDSRHERCGSARTTAELLEDGRLTTGEPNRSRS
jgi:hypothetical protein